MVITVYADVLLLLSFVVTLPVVWGVARLLGHGFTLLRGVLASLICFSATLLAIILKAPLPLMLLIYSPAFLLMALVAYGKKPFADIIKSALAILLCQVFLAGAAKLIGDIVTSGTTDGVSIFSVILGCVLLIIGIRSKRSAYAFNVATAHHSALLTVETSGRVFRFNAFIDTGNFLREPISTLPIAIIRKSAAPRELLQLFSVGKHLRYVPITTVSGTGLTPCIPATAIVTHNGVHNCSIYVCLSDAISHEAVIGTQIITAQGGTTP